MGERLITAYQTSQLKYPDRDQKCPLETEVLVRFAP